MPRDTDPLFDVEDFASVLGRRELDVVTARRESASVEVQNLDEFTEAYRVPDREQRLEAQVLPIGVSRSLTSAIDANGNFNVTAAIDIDLAEFVQTSRPTILNADRVIVRGRVKTQGQPIAIFCREIEFAENGILDTSGTPASADYTNVPATATPPGDGAHGINGMDGGAGGKGGDVLIAAHRVVGIARVNSMGGTGGRPQDGGEGRPGTPGVDGRNSDTVLKYTRSGEPPIPGYCNGIPGKDGGDAGLPGRRGRGGDGGSVTIRAVAPFSAAPVVQTNHGKHGDAGRPGRVGRGGRRGEPGTFSYQNCTRVAVNDDRAGGDSYLDCGEVNHLTGSQGDRGQDGRRFDATLADLQKDPVSRAGLSEIGVVPLPKFSQQFSSRFLDMLSWDLEDQYRQSGGLITPTIAKRMDFLHDVLANDPTNDAIKLELFCRNDVMLRKAALGLDYYGYSLIDVPILSYRTYSEQVGTDLIQNLFQLETAVEKFENAKASREGMIAQARAANDAAQVTLATSRKIYQQSLTQCQALAEEIPERERQMTEAMASLERHRTALDIAIKNKSGDDACNLQNVLISAAAIYAVVQTAGAASAAIGSIGSSLVKVKSFFTLLDGAKEMWENRSVLTKSLEQIGKSGDDLRQSLDAIRGKIGSLSPEDRKLPAFQMQKEQFDRVAQDFADFEEARSYREAGYAFLHAAAARNQSIVDFNASLLRVCDAQFQISGAQRTSNEIQSQLNQTSKPAFEKLYQAMCRMYEDALKTTAANVHRERKALAYSQNRHELVRISEINAATINDLHVRTREQWRITKEQFNPRYPLNPKKLNLDLLAFTDGKDSPAWLEFIASGKLNFTIRLDNPKYRYRFDNLKGLRMTGAQVVIKGAKFAAAANIDPSEDQIFWNIGLSGLEDAYGKDGKRVQFRHIPINISGSSSITGVAGDQLIYSEFGNDGVYAGFSPFTQWSLSIGSFEVFDFSEVSEAQLYLSGYSGTA